MRFQEHTVVLYKTILRLINKRKSTFRDFSGMKRVRERFKNVDLSK
jgi:hypothetical protein